MKKERTKCPLCYSKKIEKDYYKIPFKKVSNFNMSGYETAYFPYLQAELFCYSRCLRCKSIFVDPVDMSYWEDSEETHDKTKVKHAKEKWNWPTYTAVVDTIERYVKNHDRVMDIACGAGQCLMIMKEKKTEFKLMFGIDVGKEYIDFVKANGFGGIQGDVMKLDLSDHYGKVDAIIFHEAMEHVLEPKACVELFKKLLKPEGIIYFTVQALDPNCPVKKGENMFVTEWAIDDMFKGMRKIELNKLPDRWSGVCRKI